MVIYITEIIIINFLFTKINNEVVTNILALELQEKDMVNEKQIKWSKTSRSIYERFAAELEDGIETGSKVTSGNQDVRYGVELWRNRLNNKGLRMTYDIAPRGLNPDSDRFREWKDEHYSSRLYYRTCELRKSVYNGEKKIFSDFDNMDMYQTVTDVISGVHVDEEVYCCPNCGANVKIKELVEGCPYCNTYFKMSELYPKVSNFYFLRDYSRTEKELKGEIWKVVAPFMIVAAIGYTIVFLSSMRPLAAILSGIIGGCICGGIIGYIVWAFSKLGGLFKDAGKAIGLLANVGGTIKNFKNYMKKYGQDISYEYFQAKIISLIKVIVFSENPDDLPIYDGESINGYFDDIIDMDYRGGLALRKINEQNGILQTVVDAYMINTYEKNGKVRKREEKVCVVLERKADIPVDLGFSIKKIQCSSCASSFDATKNRVCPYCGTPYNVEEMDWLVKSIKIDK